MAWVRVAGATAGSCRTISSHKAHSRAARAAPRGVTAASQRAGGEGGAPWGTRRLRGAPPAPRAPTALRASRTPRPLQPFELERFFAKYEFCTRHLLCCSDCEPLTLKELLGIADEDSLERWESLSLGYTEAPGLPALREEAAAMYESVSADEVMCAAPEELIYLFMLALLEPGDHVVVTSPGYQSLYEIAQSLGCEVRFWEPATNDAGELEFQVQGGPGSLEEVVTGGPPPKLVVTNFPHNPTGKTLTAAQWEAVVAMCDVHGAHLFSDEMYRLLEHSPEARLPSAVDVYPRAVALSGVSKELKDYTTICGSAPSEVLALMGLRAREQLVARNLALIEENMTLLQPIFARHSDMLQWDPPVAGSIAFPRFRGDGVDADAIAEALVEGYGVLLLPGSVYGSDKCTSEARFRLGLGRAGMQEGVELFAKALDERPWVG